jgi:tetratricopeptide (TPR) repeat protein
VLEEGLSSKGFTVRFPASARARARALRNVVWLLVASWLSFAPLGAVPQVDAQEGTTAEDRQARSEFQAGRDAFDGGRWEDALTHFQKAYELSPRPVLLYNIAKAQDNLGQLRAALGTYKRYLAAVPEAGNRGAVERRVAELEVEVARLPPEVATPAEAAQAAEPAPGAGATPLAPEAPARDDRIHKKWWFWTGLGALVAGGVAVGIVAATRGNSGGGSEEPLVLDDMTRVREL